MELLLELVVVLGAVVVEGCWPAVPRTVSTLEKAHDPRPERDIRVRSWWVCATQISNGGRRGS